MEESRWLEPPAEPYCQMKLATPKYMYRGVVRIYRGGIPFLLRCDRACPLINGHTHFNYHLKPTSNRRLLLLDARGLQKIAEIDAGLQ